VPAQAKGRECQDPQPSSQARYIALMRSIGRALPSTVRPCRRKKGHRDGPEPDGSRQAGDEAPPRRGRRRHAARTDADRGQLQRQPDAGSYPRRGPRGGTGRRGRPRRRPDKLHADKGYDHRRCRHECRARNITPRIAHRGIESSQHLGSRRWIVERTLAWLARFRRRTIRYERRADLHLAFTRLACVLICRAQLKRFCP
jgi:transposase